MMAALFTLKLLFSTLYFFRFFLYFIYFFLLLEVPVDIFHSRQKSFYVTRASMLYWFSKQGEQWYVLWSEHFTLNVTRPSKRLKKVFWPQKYFEIWTTLRLVFQNCPAQSRIVSPTTVELPVVNSPTDTLLAADQTRADRGDNLTLECLVSSWTDRIKRLETRVAFFCGTVVDTLCRKKSSKGVTLIFLFRSSFDWCVGDSVVVLEQTKRKEISRL